MLEFPACHFFDLSFFEHRALFDPSVEVWLALTKLDAYLKTLSLGKIQVSIPDGAFIVEPELISIGKGTIIEPGAYIRGPCHIGENCTIRHGAYIRGHVLTGNKCVIGHDTELKQAILLDGAQAAHFAYVGDSILGNRVNLGAGTKLANLKLDHQLVTIAHQGKKIATGLRKFGAIIGDESQLGCNVVTNPGTILGKGVLCLPCINLGGVIPAYSKIKTIIPLSISEI